MPCNNELWNLKIFIYFTDEKVEEITKVEDDNLLTTEKTENLNFNLLVGVIVLSVLLLNIIIVFCFILHCRYIYLLPDWKKNISERNVWQILESIIKVDDFFNYFHFKNQPKLKKKLLNIVDVREEGQEAGKLRNCVFMLHPQMKHFQ